MLVVMSLANQKTMRIMERTEEMVEVHGAHPAKSRTTIKAWMQVPVMQPSKQRPKTQEKRNGQPMPK